MVKKRVKWQIRVRVYKLWQINVYELELRGKTRVKWWIRVYCVQNRADYFL